MSEHSAAQSYLAFGMVCVLILIGLFLGLKTAIIVGIGWLAFVALYSAIKLGKS